MTVKTKAHAGGWLKLKDDAQGEVTAAFAKLEVVDHDGDVTLPGAFQAGQKVKVCQTGHAHHVRVAGAGTIIGEEAAPDGSLWAVAELKYFLDTEAGREEFATVKALADAGYSQEWSYGYDILDAGPGQVDGKNVQLLKALSVYEISPVLRGAGIGTHTLAVKAQTGECEACGQPLPKETPVEPDEKSVDEPAPVASDEDAEATAAKARQADQLYLSLLEMKARHLSRRPVH